MVLSLLLGNVDDSHDDDDDDDEEDQNQDQDQDQDQDEHDDDNDNDNVPMSSLIQIFWWAFLTFCHGSTPTPPQGIRI